LDVEQVSYEELSVCHSRKGFGVVNVEIAERFGGTLEVKFTLAVDPRYFAFAIGVWYLEIHFTSYGAHFSGSNLEEVTTLGSSDCQIKVAAV